MSQSALIIYIAVLFLLILLSAFFSCAETALMSINRYRLRYKARMKKKSAVLILRLLKRPDRLLGAILIGNTVANIAASALATLLAFQLYGDTGVVFTTVLLALIILIFSEVAPKTLAALYSEQVSKMVAWPINGLLTIFYPLVWLINAVANGFLRLMGVKFLRDMSEPLSREELRSVVYEATGKVPHQYQSMLLGILDLNKVTVDDVMIPRHQIVGIDIECPWPDVLQQIGQSKFEWVPLFRENINQIVGVLHVRNLTQAMLKQELNKELLIKCLEESYFIPQGTLLNVQLQNFQKKKKRMALVVDEYGEIQGLITLKDILEEIVGEFTSSVSSQVKLIQPQSDGSYLIEGAITIREMNRITHWNLPTRGSRTLNGLIVEQLEAIPRVGTCVMIAKHPIEIMEVQENRVKTARVFPRIGKEDMSDGQ